MQPKGDRPIIISFRLEHLLGWGVTIALSLLPLYWWHQVNPFSVINNFSAYMLAIGRITGLIGMVMYALNLIFATRLRFLENLFGGLNRVYIAHHILGGFALILLSLHPLFLALRLIKISFLQAALLLLPNKLDPIAALFDTSSPYHSQVLQQWAVFMGIISFWGLVALLLITFFIMIPYRIWLITHKLLGVFFIIAVLHVLFITSDTSISPPLRYYLLFIAALGVLAYIYRLFAAKILVRHYNYEVKNLTMGGTGDVAEIVLVPVANQAKLSFRSGQFVFARLRGGKDINISEEWHPFSIASGPKDPFIKLAVKGMGDYTKKLNKIVPFMKMEIEGAYGKFSYSNFKNRNQIWIAGGIGITPFLSMAQDLPENDFHIDLYYSVRTASEIIDWKILYDAAISKQGQFRVIPYIGDQQPGYLNADYIEQQSGNLDGKEIFICGPPMMMKSLHKQFRDKSIPGTSIHSEEFAMS